MKPVIFDWDGESMVPVRQYRFVCDKQFVVGERYTMVVQEPRSRAAHNHYFACLEEAWRNLPEDLADDFPSSEHLRKYALIKAGFRDERSIVCASHAEAQRVAAFVKPMDEYAIVVVREATVVVLTAKSQSLRAMGGKAFQESKQSVLDVISNLIGVQPVELRTAAGQAA